MRTFADVWLSLHPLERGAFERACNAKLEIVEQSSPGRCSATLLSDGVTTLRIPLDGLVDSARERDRLSRESQRIQRELSAVRVKVDDQHFVERAPSNVIAKYRERSAQLARQLASVHDALQALP